MAAENITVAYSLLKESIVNTSPFGLDWLLPTFLIIIICVTITRDINKWKIMAFPVSILLGIIGLWTAPVIIILLALVFAVETISTQTIGNVIDVLRNKKEKAIIREELGKARRKTIQDRIKRGITDVNYILNRDITRSIAETKTGFSGYMGRKQPFGYDPTLQYAAERDIKAEKTRRNRTKRRRRRKRKREKRHIWKKHNTTENKTKKEGNDRMKKTRGTIFYLIDAILLIILILLVIGVQISGKYTNKEIITIETCYGEPTTQGIKTLEQLGYGIKRTGTNITEDEEWKKLTIKQT